MNSPTITILVVEDHEVMRFGLKSLLSNVEGFQVVGEAGNGKEAVELAKKLQPRVVVMDIVMPQMNGIEASNALKEALPDTKIVMFTSFETQSYVFAALAAGAHGYCLKNVTTNNLIAAIKTVDSGAAWFDREIASIVLNYIKTGLAQEDLEVKKLTLSPREIEVLTCVTEGLTNSEIATKLTVSVETVKTHLKRIMEKLEVSDRTQAAVQALKQGLLK
ncbi:MAG TPA: response regulator transcription factor [Drouetiella sp.]|jgi:two-component system, NarL family, response regulator LiaR